MVRSMCILTYSCVSRLPGVSFDSLLKYIVLLFTLLVHLFVSLFILYVRCYLSRFLSCVHVCEVHTMAPTHVRPDYSLWKTLLLFHRVGFGD